MKILTYQNQSIFADKNKNIEKIEEIAINAAGLGVNVVVFPELFTTGYNLGERFHELAEPIDGGTVRRLCEIALRTNVSIVTGFAESVDDQSLYNSAVVISNEGKLVAHHRKVFLFGDDEKRLFKSGNKFDSFELDGYKCGLSICYDIEFPEVARTLARNKTEILFNPTANMVPFYQVPTTLVRARALENGMVVVYANMCGEEGDLCYTGQSAVVGPDGKDLVRAGRDHSILITDVHKSLIENRSKPYSTQLSDLSSQQNAHNKDLQKESLSNDDIFESLSRDSIDFSQLNLYPN